MSLRRVRALRRIGVVAVVCGVLLLVEVAVTAVWGEPISSLVRQQDEDGLRAELDALTTAPVAVATDLKGPPRIAAKAGALRLSVNAGSPVGTLVIPRLRRSDIVVAGSSAAALRRGPGLYDGSPFPGESGTVAIAGHRTTYGAPFRRIGELRRGDAVVIRMPYGTLRYVVQSRRIVAPDDLAILRARQGEQRLVLSACHPLYRADKRVVVVASRA